MLWSSLFLIISSQVYLFYPDADNQYITIDPGVGKTSFVIEVLQPESAWTLGFNAPLSKNPVPEITLRILEENNTLRFGEQGKLFGVQTSHQKSEFRYDFQGHEKLLIYSSHPIRVQVRKIQTHTDPTKNFVDSFLNLIKTFLSKKYERPFLDPLFFQKTKEDGFVRY